MSVLKENQENERGKQYLTEVASTREDEVVVFGEEIVGCGDGRSRSASRKGQ